MLVKFPIKIHLEKSIATKDKTRITTYCKIKRAIKEYRILVESKALEIAIPTKRKCIKIIIKKTIICLFVSFKSVKNNDLLKIPLLKNKSLRPKGFQELRIAVSCAGVPEKK